MSQNPEYLRRLLSCFGFAEEKAEVVCSERCFFISGLTVATVLFGIVRSLLVFYVLVNSSQALHNKMFESILRAPVLFFDRNPIGKSGSPVNPPRRRCLYETTFQH